MTIPLTCLKKWDYKTQNKIFSKLYSDTARTEWIRGPAFIAFSKSFATSTIVTVITIGESIIKGLRLTLNPYQSLEQRQHGWTLLKTVPLQVGRNLIGVSLITFMISTFLISFDPESYILMYTEKAKVNWIHAEKGTLNSKDYKNDFRNVPSAGKTGREEWKTAR